jgi:hypothetical protein
LAAPVNKVVLRVRILSEPDPMFQLLVPELHTSESGLSPGLKTEKLRCLVALYADSGGHKPYKVVIKFHAVNLFDIETIRSIWPESPCLIMIRDPIEIMVSMLANPGGFMRLRDKPNAALTVFGWDNAGASNMTPEEYCGRANGALMSGRIGCWRFCADSRL